MSVDPRVYLKPMVLENDEILAGRPIGMQNEFLIPSLYYIYFSRGEEGPVCGVYNLNREQVDLVLSRIRNNPNIPYEDLLKDMPGVIYADEGEVLKTIE